MYILHSFWHFYTYISYLLYIQYIFFYRFFFSFSHSTLSCILMLSLSSWHHRFPFFLLRETRRNFRHYHRTEIFALSASVPFAMNNRKFSDKTNFHCDVLYDNTSRDNLSRERNSYHQLYSSFLFSSRVFRRIIINEAKLFYKVSLIEMDLKINIHGDISIIFL